MNSDVILARVQEAFMIVLLMSAPAIVVSLVTGLLIGLIQALTQIQDQSMPQTIKLVVVLVAILITGPFMAHQIVEQATAVFDEFPVVTR